MESKVPGKALVFIGSVIMWAVLLLCLVLTAPRLAGVKPYVVISGSMEPAIPVGSVVYAKEADPEELEANDIVVFYNSKDTGGSISSVTVTHRVVENHTEAGEIITKGDANPKEDIAPVSYYNVIGKVVFSVPLLGYLATPLSSTTGKVAAAMLILAGFLLTEAGNRLRQR